MTLPLYEHRDYRKVLKAWLQEPERSKRGLQGALAKAIGISSSLMTLILQGEKTMSAEQAVEASAFMGLREKESEYFILLVQHAAAGTLKWRTRLEDQLEKIRQDVRKVSGRVKSDRALSDLALAEYYSNWLYSAIRSLTALPGLQSLNTIAERLALPKESISPILEFLIQEGLCVETAEGITYGPSHLHTAADSPLAFRHHQNWRHRAFSAMDLHHKKDLFYTCTMILSEKDAEIIRSELLTAIERALERARPSASETARCLNLDFFGY